MFPENSNESKLLIYPVEVRLCLYQDFLSPVFSCTSTSNSGYSEGLLDIGAPIGHHGLTGSPADTELAVTGLRGA